MKRKRIVDKEFIQKTGMTQETFSQQEKNDFTFIDDQGTIHFFPTTKIGQNYIQYCTGLQKFLDESEIQQILQKYTSHENLYCQKLNLLLASDNPDLKENGSDIKKLKWSISYLANYYPVTIKECYRGLDCSQQEFDSYKLGKILYIPSFLSSSKNAQKFYSNNSNNTLIVIHLKYKPGNAFEVSSKFSKYAENEEEVLFSCYTKFQVVSKQKNFSFNNRIYEFYIELCHINDKQFITK